MGFSRAIIVGAALGGVAAAGIYVAVAVPAGPPPTPAALSLADSVDPASALRPRPVPVFTTLVDAPCSAPSVLEHGACVTHVAGAPTTLPAPAVRSVEVGTSEVAAADVPALKEMARTNTASAVAIARSGEHEDAEAQQQKGGHEDDEEEGGT